MTTTTTPDTPPADIDGIDLVNVVLDLINVGRCRPEVRAEIGQLKDFFTGYCSAVNDQAWETGIHRPLTGLAADRLARARQIIAEVG